MNLVFRTIGALAECSVDAECTDILERKLNVRDFDQIRELIKKFYHEQHLAITHENVHRLGRLAMKSSNLKLVNIVHELDELLMVVERGFEW